MNRPVAVVVACLVLAMPAAVHGASDAPDPLQFHEEWLICKTSDECVAIEAECPGSWRPVNTQFRGELERYLDQVRPFIECADLLPDEVVPEPTDAVCQHGVCVIPEK